MSWYPQKGGIQPGRVESVSLITLTTSWIEALCELTREVSSDLSPSYAAQV